jgi:hypothetical protein
MYLFVIATILLAFCHLAAAAVSNASPEGDPERNRWSYSGSLYTYVLPEGRDYAQPTISTDRGHLHLEARYNYEALDTGSVWFGFNYSGGEKLTWEFTPMLGGAFGREAGLVPGYKGSLTWRKFEFYSEGEYFIDTSDRSGEFFYNWSELSLAPTDWFRFGAVAQRTRAYQSDRDIQRGLLLGFSYRKINLTAYVFNPDESKPIWVFAIAAAF